MAKSKDDKKEPMGIEASAEEVPATEAKRGRQTEAPKCKECDATCVATSSTKATTYYKCPVCNETAKQARPVVRPEDRPPPMCPYCKKQTKFSKKASNAFQMAFVCECHTGYSETRYRSNMTDRVKRSHEDEELAAR